MAYVITEPCIGTKDHACVDVCPVECFYEGPDQLFINPDECIDCDACRPECPVDAIFPDTDVPSEWEKYIQKGVDAFKKGDLKVAITREKWEKEKGVAGTVANTYYQKFKK
ncbi:MAG: ferredoxin family protein [Planctomycetes bacterium]|nr:ferredoxin family protein [Planctomycetota bacterium]